MTDRAGRRAALALLGLVLALGAILLPPAVSTSSDGTHTRVAFQAVTIRPFPATAARPASPMARTAHAVHRLIGYAAHTSGPAAMPTPLLTAVLGSLLIAGASARSRLNGSPRRPRGPPALVPALAPCLAG